MKPEATDCVLTDLRMPDRDGMALQAALPQTGSLLPIVFLTGQGDIPISVQAMRHGASSRSDNCQHLPLDKGFVGIGANGFYYEPITGDSGSDTLLDDFTGRTERRARAFLCDLGGRRLVVGA